MEVGVRGKEGKGLLGVSCCASASLLPWRPLQYEGVRKDVRNKGFMGQRTWHSPEHLQPFQQVSKHIRRR